MAVERRSPLKANIYMLAGIIGIILLILVLTGGCQSADKPDTKELKAKIQQALEEAWNNGDVDVLDELYDPGFVRHRPPFDDYTGLDAHKQRIEMIRTAYPDHKTIVHDILVEGDRAAVRYTWIGTHTGNGLSIPPTGKQVSVDGCDVYRFVNGKIVEEWVHEGYLSLFQQLGYTITPPEAVTE